MRFQHGHTQERDREHVDVGLSIHREALVDILIISRHYIEEVKGVQQVLDQEEEIALKEFAKFEEKLAQQKGRVPPSTVGAGTLDTAE
jgi:uncharacterized protein YjcR